AEHEGSDAIGAQPDGKRRATAGRGIARHVEAEDDPLCVAHRGSIDGRSPARVVRSIGKSTEATAHAHALHRTFAALFRSAEGSGTRSSVEDEQRHSGGVDAAREEGTFFDRRTRGRKAFNGKEKLRPHPFAGT